MADKVRDQMGAHEAKAAAFLGGDFKPSLPSTPTTTGRVTAPNTEPVRLKVDGTDDKPLRRPGNAELPPGETAPNTVYRAVWLPALDAYHVVSPHIERLGRTVPNATVTAESGYLLCDGKAYWRVSCAALFAAIGTTYGAGDGSNTFNVPDTRSRALFGVERLGSSAARSRRDRPECPVPYRRY